MNVSNNVIVASDLVMRSFVAASPQTSFSCEASPDGVNPWKLVAAVLTSSRVFSKSLIADIGDVVVLSQP